LLLRDWVSAQPNPPDISVLTVDHGLRSGSDAEAKIVADWCRGFGFRHKILRWASPKPVTGIQAKARAARYELMTHWCISQDVPVLLTAHTADDQNETVVMRQKRTESVRSLAGIWPARDWNGVRILRPVLAMKRQDLRDILKSKRQDWLDDPSNENHKFERVRVRHELAGRNEEQGAVAATAQRQVLEAEDFAQSWVQAHVAVSELGLVRCDVNKIAALEGLEADAVLVRLLALTGRRNLPEREHRQNLLAWMSSDELGRRTLGGVVFAKRKAALVMAREAGRIDPAPVVIPPEGEVIWDGRFRITGPAGAVIQPLGTWGDVPHKEIPQFLRLGLPAAMIDGKLTFVPQLKPNPLFNYRFINEDVSG
jgi:tRNA(Ile)-lysidine synthase